MIDKKDQIVIGRLASEKHNLIIQEPPYLE